MWQKFWQHFLRDNRVLETIVEIVKEMVERYEATHCIEIWPGRWALTKHLAALPVEQTLFEVDTTLRQWLDAWTRKNPHQRIVRWDFLQADLKPFDLQRTIVAGNLPYYITSPILRKCFVDHEYCGWVFLIQKEVAEKICTSATKKSYLRWLINYQNSVDLVCMVPPEAFDPPPKVHSAVIRVERTNQAIIWSMEQLVALLEMIARYSRKTIGKSLALAWIDAQVRATLDPLLLKKRLEACSWDEIEQLIKLLD
jgi:16S rRNA (adenine1518-N6/adenine1519-N6)-dimethyltransferase